MQGTPDSIDIAERPSWRPDVASAVLALVCCLPAFAQGGRLAFSRIAPRGAAPSPRLDAPLVYDRPARRLLLFGGGDDNGPRNDLWAFSLDRAEWSALSPAGPLPPARIGHTSIFDPVRRRIVIFAGQAGAGFFSDVWAYEIEQNTWRLLAADNTGPSRRYGHSAIYETARDRMIISHGFTDAGRFDDTWALSLGTNTWQNISPSSNRPLKRCLHHAVYDANNGQMLLYGGCSSGFGPCPQDDLWSFDLNTQQWTKLSPQPQPAGRQWYGAAFDNARNRMVVFAGSGSSGALNDTWEYDTSAKLWIQQSPEGQVPSARSRLEATYVDDLKAAFFFGGRTNAGLSHEIWMLSASTAASEAVVNAASFAPSTAVPGAIITIFGRNLAAGTETARSSPLPLAFAGSTVKINNIATPLFYASPSQVNLQVPWEVSGQEALVTVTAGGITSVPVVLPVAPAFPGVFTTNQSGTGQGAVLISGTNGNLAAPASVPNGRPVRRGEFIEIFATGLGAVTATPESGSIAALSPLATTVVTPAVTIGGAPAAVSFAGLAPGYIGLYQVNVQVPVNAPAGDAVALVLGIGSPTVTSNTVTIAVQP